MQASSPDAREAAVLSCGRTERRRAPRVYAAIRPGDQPISSVGWGQVHRAEAV
jgi:hypothetical protein